MCKQSGLCKLQNSGNEQALGSCLKVKPMRIWGPSRSWCTFCFRFRLRRDFTDVKGAFRYRLFVKN